MKSKFMKSMQLLWQSSPVTNEEDEVLQEKESARQDCSIDPALAKEYVLDLSMPASSFVSFSYRYCANFAAEQRQ